MDTDQFIQPGVAEQSTIGFGHTDHFQGDLSFLEVNVGLHQFCQHWAVQDLHMAKIQNHMAILILDLFLYHPREIARLENRAHNDGYSEQHVITNNIHVLKATPILVLWQAWLLVFES